MPKECILSITYIGLSKARRKRLCCARETTLRNYVVKIPIAYPVGGGDKEFADFVNQWILLKKNGLGSQRLYDHWILGQDAVPKQPRWSIIRDVLQIICQGTRFARTLTYTMMRISDTIGDPDSVL